MSFLPIENRSQTFAVTSVANPNPDFSIDYTGTFPGGAANGLSGYTFTVAGFTNAANNGVFLCLASTATTLTLYFNFAGSAETHAATATTSPFIGLGPAQNTGEAGFPAVDINISNRVIISTGQPVIFSPAGLQEAVAIGCTTEYLGTAVGDEVPCYMNKVINPSSSPVAPFTEIYEGWLTSDPAFTGDASACFMDVLDMNTSLRSPAHFGQVYGMLLEHGAVVANGAAIHIDDFRRIYAESLNGNGSGSNAVYNFGKFVGFNCATGGFFGPQNGIAGTSWAMNFEGPRLGGGNAMYTSHMGIRMASQQQGAVQGTFTLTAVASAVTNVSLTLTSVATAADGLTVYTGTITGGGSNAFTGYYFTISGFTTSANNGTFFCVASSATTLTLVYSGGVSETHAATAVLSTADYTGTFQNGGANAFAGQVFNIAGFVNTGSALTLTSVGDPTTLGSLPRMSTYVGTITGGDSNGHLGRTFTVAGFTNGSNNGTFLCYASTATTLTLGGQGGSAAAETHAATATVKVNNGIFRCKASTTTTITLNNYQATAETHAGTAISRNGAAWGIHQDDGGERNAFGTINLGGESGPLFSAGSASPESSITSSVGGLYLRTGGSAGTALYSKETGSSNTGWIPLRNATINAQTGTSYAIADGDRGKAITFSNTAAQAVTIAQAGTGGNFLSGWYAYVQNINTGTVTITPSTSTVNSFTTLVLNQNQAAMIYTDGVNYFAIFTKIASSGDAAALSAYVQNDAGTGAAANQVVVRDIGTTAVNSKRKGLNVYLESNGAQAGGANFDGLQVNAGITVDANTILTGHFEAAEFYVAASGTGFTVPQTNGIKVRTTITGSATVGNVVPILMYLPTFNAGSTTSNYTGIFLDNPVGGGTVTNACAAMFQMGTGSLINTNAYGVTAGGKTAAIIADDSTATGSFIGHGPVSGGSMPFTLHDGWYGFTGSPEGSLSANVGSIYSRQNSTIGDAFYVKGTGSGNTGWAPCATLSPIVTKTTTYSATNADGTILGNGTFTITLPSTLLPTGKTLRIKNIGTGTITVSSAVNIDGSTSFTLPTQYQSADVQWDGTQWWIL
jgi:hypothetical protein